MRMNRTSRIPTAALGVVLLGAAACIPLPIAHSAQVTPQVVGTLQDESGAPLPGARIALTESGKDVACRGPGGRGVTDGGGRFAMPSAATRKRIFWLTMIESFGATAYWLCAGAPPGSSTADTTLAQSRTHIVGWMQGDSLACLAWRWRTPRVTCNGGPNQQLVMYAGRWTAAGESGVYRLLLVDADESGYELRAVVQWLATTRAVEPGLHPVGTVRAQVELPTGKGVAKYETMLIERDGVLRVRLQSVVPTNWGNARWLMFDLGAPGEVRVVDL